MFLSAGWDSLKERLDDLLPQGSLRARFVRGTFWSTAGVAVAQLSALAAAVLVARIYDSKELYGELGMIRNTVMMFGVVAGLGLGLTATKFVAEFRRADPARAGRIVGMSATVALVSASVMALLVLVFAPWVAERVLSAPTLEVPLRIGCLILFFEALNGAQIGALSGLEAFKTVAQVSLLRGVITFPLMVAGAWLGMRHGEAWGLRAVVIALAASSASGWLINRIALRRTMRREGVPVVPLGFARAELPVLRSFALPAFLNNTLAMAALVGAQAILVRKTESGYESLGVFNAANQWQYPMTLLAGQLGVVLLPMIASFQSEPGGDERTGRVTEAANTVIAAAALWLAAVLSCFAGPIMSLYGAKFAPYVWVFWAAIFVAGVKCISVIPGTVIQARGAMWTAFFINLAGAALQLALVGFWAVDAESFANCFSVAYAVLCVAGFFYLRMLGIVSWSLVLKVWAAMAGLAAFTYGMGWADSTWLRAAGVAAATIIAGATLLAAWRTWRAARAPESTSEPVEGSPSCPICGGPSRPDGAVLAGHAILVCDKCSHRFAVVPMLSSQGYDSLCSKGSYRKSYIEENDVSTQDALLEVTYQPFFENVSPAEFPRLLDVACGTGRVCKTAARLGWDATGIDISAEAIAVASRGGGAKFHVMSADEAAAKLDGFDVVTAFEFLEHNSDPAGMVGKLKGLARPGGLVLVTVPSWAGPGIRDTKNPEWVPPVHLQFFTAQSLRTLFERAGFRDVQVGPIRRRWRVRGPRSLLRVILFRLQKPFGLYCMGVRP